MTLSMHIPNFKQVRPQKSFTLPDVRDVVPSGNRTVCALENLVGGFNPSEKYESQLGLLFPIYGKS
jgi:hypothetical protein